MKIIKIPGLYDTANCPEQSELSSRFAGPKGEGTNSWLYAQVYDNNCETWELNRNTNLFFNDQTTGEKYIYLEFDDNTEFDLGPFFDIENKIGLQDKTECPLRFEIEKYDQNSNYIE